ncbi:MULTISPECIES: DUF1643 domain-containing protein [Haloferax]|uniref:DUF1643 domain-containing protein n=2 Tax=Haloferax TaxID=2251 RepID=A0A6G1Z0P3_9EURY|nr:MULTISPECIES: DUF1643 domain-containing protein [Haloferax]KAB1187444.1 DUF1643 domain-containing protein [Haloferax sp. CBA1149]MRW80096.1 DUF1643 domain-containing protein [Haloferax marinisediminis]
MLIDEWAFDPQTVDGVFVEMGDIDGYTEAGAILSDDEAYRYLLWRVWDPEKPTLTYIMCNPSDGRGTKNDRTLDRCESFARANGCGSFVVGNLFARRTPNHEELRADDDPIGPENDRFLESLSVEAETVVAAWGRIGQKFGRVEEVVAMLDVDLYAIHVNTDGSPQHPLYAKHNNELTRWHPDA